jgi:hypothetical protein
MKIKYVFISFDRWFVAVICQKCNIGAWKRKYLRSFVGKCTRWTFAKPRRNATSKNGVGACDYVPQW